MKKIVLLLGLTLLWSAWNSYAYAQEINAESTSELLEIGSIKVSGAVHTDESLIIAKSGLKQGQKIKIPGLATGQAVRKLMSTRLLAEVEIHEQKRIGEFVFLEIEVKELPRLEKIVLEGLNKKRYQRELTEILETLLPKNTSITQHLQNAAEIKILDYFEEQGMPNAEVNFTQKINSTSNNTIDLVCEINPNSRVKTSKIYFSGNENASASTLKKKMTETKAGQFFGKSEFIEANFEQDKNSILQYYRSQGYRDAIISNVKKVTDKEGKLFLSIEIEEGDLYYFGDISFRGNTVYPTELLQTVLEIKKGDVFNETLLQERLLMSPDGSDISSLYLDNGFLFFQLKQKEIALNDNAIDLEIHISEGRKATIGKVLITGNDKTSEEVIRRELRTRPGDEFSRAAIIRSQRELANMGYFNPQTLNIKTEINQQNGTVDIEYVVEEKPNDQLELSAGWQPNADGDGGGVVGTVGVSFNNFSFKNLFNGELPFGDGQQVGIRAQSSGKTYQSLNLSFTEPWLGGKKPQNLTFGTYFTRYASSYTNDLGEIPYLRIMGGKVSFSSRLNGWDDYLVSSTNLTYENIDLYEFTDIDQEDGTVINQGNFNNLYLKQSFSRNTTDAPFFPRQGSILEFSGQFTAPYSLLSKNTSDNWLEYHKWRIGGDFYLPLTKKMVFKGSIKAGYLGRYNQDKSRSVFERFDLDGDALQGTSSNITGNDFIYLRGYEREELPAVANGGAAIFNKFTAELRYSLLETGPASAYGLIFAEAGNAWDDFGSYNPFDLKRSVGVGLRVQVPMIGVLGFDYSLGFDSELFDKSNWYKSGKFSVILGFDPD